MVRTFEPLTLSRHRGYSGAAGLVILAIFTLLGLALGSFMMYVGWQHNSQGEFYDETGVHWGYWFLIGLSWFLLITGVPFGIALALFIRRFIIRSRDARSAPTI